MFITIFFSCNRKIAPASNLKYYCIKNISFTFVRIHIKIIFRGSDSVEDFLKKRIIRQMCRIRNNAFYELQF